MRAIVFTCALFPAAFIHAEDSELNSFDLESLLATDVQITSAMKRTQVADKTAASVYVLSNQQIQNSGVNSIAQALTLVPGMQVRQIDGNKWAISSRAKAGRYTSKLLVMVDGQSIYNPAFAGVYWEALNIPLYDIERIEVIKGQGGILWGSNATNGVVNIITKHSLDTRSSLVKAQVGTTLNHRVSFRTGDELNISKHSSYRIYASHEKSRKSDQATVWEPRDEAKKINLGGRLDLTINDDSSLIIQGDYTDIDIGQTLHLPSLETHKREEVGEPEQRQHGQLMLRLDNRLSDTSNQMIQASISTQKGTQTYFNEDFRHYDVDYQLNMLTGSTQTNVGLNFRYNDIPFTSSQYIQSLGMKDSITQYGGFVQTNITLLPNMLDFIIGNKSEHNSLTGWEHQPSARLTFTPNNNNFVWASVSQSVRVPSLTEYDYETLVSGVKISDFITTNITAIDDSRLRTVLQGNPNVEAEKTIAAEAGYRLNYNEWKFDFSFFKAKSKNTLGVSPQVPDSDIAAFAALIGEGNILGALNYLNNTTVDIVFIPDVELHSKGVDFIITWQPTPLISTELGYNFTSYTYENPSDSIFADDGNLQQIFLSSTFQLTDNQSVFSLLRWEDGEAYNTDDYIALDLSWVWNISPQTNLSLTGNNILDSEHLEYGNTNDTLTVATYIDRSITLGFTFNF